MRKPEVRGGEGEWEAESLKAEERGLVEEKREK